MSRTASSTRRRGAGCLAASRGASRGATLAATLGATLAGAALWMFAACGGALAQSGGLDMDVNPTAPAANAATPKTGELDMDVNASVPITQPGAAAAAVPGTSRGRVQDGITMIVPKQEATPDAAAAPAGAAPANPAPASPAPANNPVQSVSIPQSGGVPQPAGVTGVPQPDLNAPSTDGAAAAGTAPQAPPIALDHPKVVDTAKLATGETSVSLYGIEGLSGEAAEGLQGYVAQAGNKVTCQAQPGADFVCLLPDGTDVAQAALINGAARTKDDAPDSYRDQEIAAQAARRGIWANLPPPPVVVKHPTVPDSATLVADGQSYELDGLHGFGLPYSAQLQGYIAANGDTLSCNPQGDTGRYVCLTADGTDLAKIALVNGAAEIGPGAPDAYRVQQGEALTNKRGIWLHPTKDILVAVSQASAEPDCCTLVEGDDGVDGITYVGGVPEALIDGVMVVLAYGGDDVGWGYYDPDHHWRGAPGHFGDHLNRFHSHGEGLRGYRGEASALSGGARGGQLRAGAGGMRAGGTTFTGHSTALAAARPGMAGASHGGFAGAARPGAAGAAHPGFAGAARPGVGGGARPGFGGAARPGFGGGARPGFASAGRPGGGFVHPGPSAGGFHPGAARAPAMHAAAPIRRR